MPAPRCLLAAAGPIPRPIAPAPVLDDRPRPNSPHLDLCRRSHLGTSCARAALPPGFLAAHHVSTVAIHPWREGIEDYSKMWMLGRRSGAADGAAAALLEACANVPEEAAPGAAAMRAMRVRLLAMLQATATDPGPRTSERDARTAPARSADLPDPTRPDPGPGAAGEVAAPGRDA